jgi:hypothetical protein
LLIYFINQNINFIVTPMLPNLLDTSLQIYIQHKEIVYLSTQ